jgi:hypothetical protein
MVGLDDAAREALWTETRAELRRFESPAGVVVPTELLVAAGTK